MKLLYISNGNIPSRWAHTVQIMKMAEALSPLVSGARGFRLLVASGFPGAARRWSELRDLYGLRRRVSLVRLRMDPESAEGFSERVSWPEFETAAVAYAVAARPTLVMTRSYRVGLACLDEGLEVIFETHAGPGHSRLDVVAEMGRRASLRGLVTIAEPLRALYEEQGVPSDRILVWPDAVDPHRFQGLPDPAAARRALGLPAAATIVLYSGHLYEEKGIGTLLELAHERPDLHVIAVGGWERDIERLREQHGSLPNVDLRGFVPNAEVPRYLAAASVLALPSSARDRSAGYTSPLKLFEYMAARRPIVASDIQALRTVLDDGRNALLVPPDDPAAFGAAVDRLASNEDEGERLARQAWSDVQQYTWTDRAAAILGRFAPELLRRSVASARAGAA